MSFGSPRTGPNPRLKCGLKKRLSIAQKSWIKELRKASRLNENCQYGAGQMTHPKRPSKGVWGGLSFVFPRPRLSVLMLSNPLNRVIFRNKPPDYFRFAIGPQNIDPPARPGIFPRHESWSLLGHPSNMRLCRPRSSQLSCHNQADRRPQTGFMTGGAPIDRAERAVRWRRSAGTMTALNSGLAVGRCPRSCRF